MTGLRAVPPPTPGAMVTHPRLGSHSLASVRSRWVDRERLPAAEVDKIRTLLTEGTITDDAALTAQAMAAIG